MKWIFRQDKFHRERKFRNPEAMASDLPYLLKGKDKLRSRLNILEKLPNP